MSVKPQIKIRYLQMSFTDELSSNNIKLLFPIRDFNWEAKI